MTQPEAPPFEVIDGNSTAAAAQYEVLSEGIASVPVRRAKEFPLEKVLITLGAILVPLGVGLILLAWYGVAHTIYGFEQNSYIVSGGLLGLGLIFAGGFSYFGYWLTRQIRTSSRAHRETMRLLERLERDSAAAAASMVAVVRLLEAHLSDGRGPAMAVATKRGTLLHRTNCPVVAEKRDLRRVRANEPGFRPCHICFTPADR